jgi:IstB-like ATP binding protein
MAIGASCGDPVIATAIFDRLLRHSTMINIHGESYRPDGWPVLSVEADGGRTITQLRSYRTVLALMGPPSRTRLVSPVPRNSAASHLPMKAPGA